MNRKAKIIKFPCSYSDSKTSFDEPDEPFDSDDFEDWDGDYSFIYKEDYMGLVKYREQKAYMRPNDLYAQCALGKAYVLNRDYEKAIDFLSKLHRKAPDWEDVQHLILDALFAIGKNENDFHWLKKPVIVKLTKNVLNSCYEYLRRKRKPQSVEEIYLTFLGSGYIQFTSEELLKAMKQDERFIIDNPDEIPFFAEVRVGRKHEK